MTFEKLQLIFVKQKLKEMKAEERICDKCNNFEVTMDCTTEICHAKKDGSKVIPKITDYYIEERMYGDKKNCKCFAKIIDYTK